MRTRRAWRRRRARSPAWRRRRPCAPGRARRGASAAAPSRVLRSAVPVPLASPRMSHHQLVILGSGPAGLTAALYAARANLAPVVIEGHAARRATYHNDRSGELSRLPRRPAGPGDDGAVPQAGGALRRRRSCSATSARSISAQRPFTLAGRQGAHTRCDALIIATGASAKLLGHRVGAAADGLRRLGLRHLRRLLLQGQDRASSSAAATRRWRRRSSSPSSPRKVHVVHRRDELRASKIMAERAERNPKIALHLERARSPRSTATPHGAGVTGVTLEDTADRRAPRARLRRRLHRHRPSAEHRAVRRPARARRDRLHRHPGRAAPTPACRACSPAATCRITSTARRSPPPAPAAWRRSTPSAGSRRRRTLAAGDAGTERGGTPRRSIPLTAQHQIGGHAVRVAPSARPPGWCHRHGAARRHTYGGHVGPRG